MSVIDLDQILPLVHKPSQYIGSELHAADKQLPADALKFCLIFPDLYEIGMSHQGLQILYHILNRRSQTLAHRAYAPEKDMEAILRQRNLPLFSLEAAAPLGSYDALGFTLPYELCYTNILTILDLARLPLRSADRDEQHPLVLAGGAGALNPEPVADFFDAIALGDGEELILELADLLTKAKAHSMPREEQLAALANIPGIYVPSLFQAQYTGDRLTGIKALRPGYEAVQRRILPELKEAPYLHQPLVPVLRTVHDRLAVEIARGCTRGCRFCQAGIIYRPVRERHPDEVMELARAGIDNSGFEELSLLSLSTGDYACLEQLIGRMMDHFARSQVSLSMPSMRVGTISGRMMEQIRRVRKTGFTVAPEAGSERLRQVINKGITEEDLLKTCKNAFELGWKLIKCYFMIGLPTETEEDLRAIAELVKKAKRQGANNKGRPVQINLGIATFVPKPHTPFQWEEQISLEESRARINLLKSLLPRHGFKIKWHEPEQSFLEGVFARGDRRLSLLVEQAWQMGARLDSWSEHFDLERWRAAAAECKIDLESYLKAREPGAPLPWDHLQSGVDAAFLLEEYQRALRQDYTPDCREHGCQGCGLCDFKHIQPVIHHLPLPDKAMAGLPPVPEREHQRKGPPQRAFTYRVHYSRLGISRFYSHLELLQLVFRSLQRASLPLIFSKGFNPTPQVAFSQALPVSMESQAEYFDMDLSIPLRSLETALATLRSSFPEEISIRAITLAPGKNAAKSLSRYEIRNLACPQEILMQRVSSFLAQESFPITRIRKFKRQELDLRALVRTLEQGEDCLIMELRQDQGQAGTSPVEVLRQGLNLSEQETLLARIMKTETREMHGPA